MFIQSISPTEETAEGDRRAGVPWAPSATCSKYMQFKAARAMGDAARRRGGEAGSLAGAGVGLGAGLGMGAGMAGMISQAMARAPCSAAGGSRCGRPRGAAPRPR